MTDPPADFAPRKAIEPDGWVLRVSRSGMEERAAVGEGGRTATDGHLTVHVDGIMFESATSAERVPRPANHVLAEYKRVGVQAFANLRGWYTIVIADSRADETIVVRDHMGIVPLFWANGAKGLAVSPSVKALARESDIGSTLNRPAIAEWVMLRWHDAAETLFANVHRVPPGHYLRSRGARRDLVRYWNPLEQDDAEWVTAAQLDGLEELLTLAIRRCTSIGNPAILLSGGLDSVSIASLASSEDLRSGARAPLALSIVFPDPSCNEEQVQRRVAETLGLPQIVRGLYEAAHDLNLLRPALLVDAEWPQPAISYWIAAYESIMAEGVAGGCEVILTGLGGDEWLGVTPYYTANLLRRADLAGLWRLWRSHSRSHQTSPMAVLRRMLWTFGARDLLVGSGVRALDRISPTLVDATRLKRLRRSMASWELPDPNLRASVEERVLRSRRSEAESDLYRRELDRGLTHPLVVLEAEENHERGVRAGAPLRHPYLDVDVVQFLVRTPPELLNKHGLAKGPVREMVAQRLPGLGFDRQKKVAATSFATNHLLDHLPKIWRDLGGLTALADLGAVGAAAIESEACRVFDTGDGKAVHRLWYLVALEAWVRAQ